VEALAKGINYICSDGGEKVDSSFTTCDGSGSDAKCSVYFFLPQATTSIEDWIPGSGDPKYLVYHEAFPPGEDIAWSGWQTVSMALVLVPGMKSAGGALKQGLKGGLAIGKESAIVAFEGTVAVYGTEAAIKQTPGIIATGFKEGLTSKVLKNGVESAIEKGSIGVRGGVIASEATKYAVSTVEKFIPCDTNSLCVKSAFTVRSQYVQPKAVPLSAACKGTYIELNKLWEAGTKFYLASPCNVRLDIVRGKCNCALEMTELGEKEMIICSQYFNTTNYPACTARGGNCRTVCLSDQTDIGIMDCPQSGITGGGTCCVAGTKETENFTNYQSDCIKITPHEIKTGKENFCYTPTKVFDYVATGISLAGFACPLTGPAAPVCYAATAIGSAYFDSRTAWPHGFLEAE